jgi:hypothetical protein
MNPADRDKLRRLLKSFDEAGLVALANKGLVRRALKDLAGATLTFEETDTEVVVRGPDWTVVMPPEGPAHAKDDTKATGVTRQILMATAFLRDSWGDAPAEAGAPADVPPPPSLDELQTTIENLTLEQLRKWAGKTVCREAELLAQNTTRVDVELGANVTLRLVEHDIEVRVFPGPTTANALLDQALASGPKATRPRSIVAAVLAFQRQRGKVLTAEPARLREAAGAPRTRAAVLAAATESLEAMIGVGLAHPSERMQERLLTLSMSALGVQLPRLSRLLRTLADDLGLSLRRDAKADSGRIFDLAARTFALLRALAATEDPAPHLVGRHRTDYLPAGDLFLSGMGSYPWKSATGFEGITVLFWDETRRAIRSWSYSRPADVRGLNLEQAYRVEGAWGVSIERLSRSRLRLSSARENAFGRLSASQGTTAEVLELTAPDKLELAERMFTSWSTLADFARTAIPSGLAELRPLDGVAVLKPQTWGTCIFEEATQQLVWPLGDETGKCLRVSLPWTDANESTIEFLERIRADRDRLTAIVCQLRATSAGIVIEPLSLLSGGTPNGDLVLNPGFDRDRVRSRQSSLLDKLREKYGRNRLHAVIALDEDDASFDSPMASLETFPIGLRLPLAELESAVLHQAEAGARRVDEAARRRFSAIAPRLKRVNLDDLSACCTGEGDWPRRLLWTGYLLRLLHEARAVEAISADA